LLAFSTGRRQVLINGHTRFRGEADAAEAALDQFVGVDENKRQLVEALEDLLNAACRASSMIENVSPPSRPGSAAPAAGGHRSPLAAAAGT
jgi:hypothetical protein